MTMMRVALAWIVSYLGIAIWQLGQWTYPAYDRLMRWSHDLQDGDPRGPWRKET
jgi:hypothetical protein